MILFDVHVICAGNFGREVAAFVPECLPSGEYRLASVRDLFVDQPFTAAPTDRFVIATSDPILRLRLGAHLAAHRAELVSLVHPRAYVASSASIGAGCLVLPLSFVGVNARLAPNVAINVQATVGHDVELGPGCMVQPHAMLAGRVTAGRACLFSAHSFVAAGLSVGENSRLAPGVMVSRSIAADSLAAGNPATARVLYRPLDELLR